MSHELSFAFYQDVRDNPTISPTQYEDLESLVNYFGLLDPDGEGIQEIPIPDRFTFHSQAPSLLIVEDEIELAELLGAILVNKGYPPEAIHTFPSGEEAILYVKTHAVGIALVDIRLSNTRAVRDVYTSGLQVLREIKKASPGAKVILVSGFGTYEMIREAMLDSGASYYLRKPFRTADILRIVHWAVERLLGPDITRMISASERPGRSEQPGRSEKILVVDDDPVIAEGIVLAFRTLGYQARAAGGGLDALNALEASRFDAVLLDVKMPEMDGLEVLRRIRQRDREVVVFMLTAFKDEKTAREAIELGAYDFMIKPCDLNLMQLTLEYAFAERQTERGV